MEKQSFNTPKVLRTNTTFPQAVIAGDYIFISGTAGIDSVSGKLISADFEEQAMQAFNNVQTILQEAGSSLENVVKTTVFMVSGCDPDFVVINKIYASYFPENAPARSAPQVMPFPAGILISIECIAYL
jgi:2-iminobutanoate/2-iminopropanoate deaminase